MHDTNYKHVNMIIEKTTTIAGVTVLSMKWQLAYVTQSKGKSASQLDNVLQTKRKELVHCVNCANSEILLAQPEGKYKILYSLEQPNMPGRISV